MSKDEAIKYLLEGRGVLIHGELASIVAAELTEAGWLLNVSYNENTELAAMTVRGKKL